MDSTLGKVVPIGVDNFLEDIGRHGVQYIDDFIICNKHYKEEYHGSYVTNVEPYNITGILGWSHIIEDGNELLQTIDLEVKEGKIPALDRIEVSTFTTKTLPLADEILLDILSKNQDSISPGLLVLNKHKFRPREG